MSPAIPHNVVEQGKSVVRRLLRAVGFEVHLTRNANIEPVVLARVLAATGAEIVLDVGANLGQFGDEVFRTGFKGTLVSFEAIPAVHAQLARHASRHGGSWVVAPCAALGSRCGQTHINIAANVVSSSLLPMTDAHRGAAPHSAYVEKQLVEITTLDQVGPTVIPPVGNILLKVDTQGYEMEVLRGASATLRRTVALQLELSLTALYEGAPSFLDMIQFVKEQGYELFSLVPGFWDTKSGRLLQMDGFFIRRKADVAGGDARSGDVLSGSHLSLW
jgi:FkbM family methyltransferase